MKPSLIELASFQATDQRRIVISTQPKEGKVIIGQQLKAQDEAGKDISFFLKGALSIPTEAIVGLRDKINEAISKLERDNLL